MMETGAQRRDPGDSFVFRFAKIDQMWPKTLRLPSQGFSLNLFWAEPSHRDRRHHHWTQHTASAALAELGEVLQPLNRLNLPSLGIRYSREGNWGIKSNKHWISLAQLACFLEIPRKRFSSLASLSCSLWLILLYSPRRKWETWDLYLTFHI